MSLDFDFSWSIWAEVVAYRAAKALQPLLNLMAFLLN